MRHLLLVEGHAGVRDALARRLRRVYTVTAVGGLGAACAALRQLPPAAVSSSADGGGAAGRRAGAAAARRPAGDRAHLLAARGRGGAAAPRRRVGLLLKGRPFDELLARIEATLGGAPPVPPR